MDYASIRKHSHELMSSLGAAINYDLPLYDSIDRIRSCNEIAGRMLSLHALVAYSYGMKADSVRKWLGSNKLVEYLSDQDKTLLSSPLQASSKVTYQWQVERIWVLAWSCNYHNKFAIGKCCDDSLAQIMPNLKEMPDCRKLITDCKLRPKHEIIQAADSLYCLHWFMVDSLKNKRSDLLIMPIQAIREQRIALEWMLSNEDWDDIELDT